MADIAKINGLNLKDAAARADIATAKTDIAGIKDGTILTGKALKDASGSDIRNYIQGLRISGRTITYTKGDGTTGTITTQDTNTTYNLATTTQSGLMSSTDKGYVNNAMRPENYLMSDRNGYMDLVNTNLRRLQFRWGYATPSNGKIAVNFASSFSSTCLAVIGCAINAQPTTTLLSFKASAKSATGFTAYCSYTNSAGAVAYADEIFCWFAIGY